MTPDWMLDELAHAGADHLDDTFVAGYDRKQGEEPDTAAASDLELLRRHGIDGGSTVVDLGAGTGRFAAAVAPHVGRFVAVELSPVMLAALERRLRGAGLLDASASPQVEMVRSGLLSYEHAGAPADAVHTRNVLHQIPDAFKVLALHRIAGMLRPGGVLRLRDLVYDTSPGELPEVLAAWFAGAVDDPAAGYTAADLAEHVRTEFSTFSWLLEPMLDAAGFDIVDRDTSRRTFAAYTCVRR